MDIQKAQFTENTGLLFEQMGMTRMAGRIFGYLIVSEKDSASFDELCTELQASKGSISGNLKQLIQIEFVEPIGHPGDRKTYYRPVRKDMISILKARTPLLIKFRDMLSEAHSLREQDDHISEWLVESTAFFHWYLDKINDVFAQWPQEKEGYLKSLENKTGTDHET